MFFFWEIAVQPFGDIIVVIYFEGRFRLAFVNKLLCFIGSNALLAYYYYYGSIISSKILV